MPSFTLFSFRFIERSAKKKLTVRECACVRACMSVNTYSIVWLYQISWTNGIVSFRTWQIPQCGSGSGMNLWLTNHKTLMQINQPYIVLYYITLHRTCVRTVWTALVNWSIDLGTFLQQIRIFIRFGFFPFHKQNFKTTSAACVRLRLQNIEMIKWTSDCPHIQKMLWSTCAFKL